MKYRWLARSVPKLHLKKPSEGFSSLPPSLALMLARRGMDEIKIRSFLNPCMKDLSHWTELPGIKPAVERIAAAVGSDEKILVHGDFDADGVTATALTCLTIRRLGGDVAYYIPDRFRDGYGIGKNSIKVCIESGAKLMITVDCGITEIESISAMSAEGIETVVTDHHQSSTDIPEAVAVVDPVLSEEGGAWRDLSGAGVAFMTMLGLCETLGQDSCLIEDLLPLVSIGTVCDVVPLTDDNRILVCEGLKKMSAGVIPGLASIADCAGTDLETVSSRDIAFSIGPRLNSAGRIGHAESAVRLFLSENSEETRELALLIEQYNTKRKKLDGRVLRDAREMAKQYPDSKALVLSSSEWHRGVIGIAASRLSSETGLPVVLISIDGDTGRGSCRSVEGVSIHDILGEIQADMDLFLSYGGHHMAAGLSIRTDGIDSFRKELDTRVSRLTGGEYSGTVLWLDGHLEEEDYSIATVRALEKLEPFGSGNEEPVWLARSVYPVSWRTVGDGRHLSCLFQIGNRRVRAIGFNMSDRQAVLHRSVDLAFSLREDKWSGNGSVQLHLRDIRPAGALR